MQTYLIRPSFPTFTLSLPQAKLFNCKPIMAERPSRRRSFRFRLPRLLTAAPATTKPPTKQATEIPIQGSSFQPPRRPPGTNPSPQLQAQPGTKSQPPSPSSTAPLQLPSQPPSPSLTASPPSRKVPPSPQSQKTFQPPSPSRTSPLRSPSQPPSPSLTASPRSRKVPPSPKSQKTFQPPSPSPTPQLQPAAAAQTTSSPPSTPSKAVPSPSHTASQPPSPSHTSPPQQTHGTIPLSPSPPRTAPEEQPEAQAASQPSSPTQQAPPQASSLLSMPSQNTSQLPSPLMLSAAHDETALPQPPSQKPQTLVETSSKPVYPSQIENQVRATTISGDAAKYPSQASGQVVARTSPSREVRETPFLQQTSPKAEETKAEQIRSLEPKREEPKPSADEEPKQRTIMELVSLDSGLSAKTRGQSNITPQDKQKKQEMQAALEGKQTTETGFKESKTKVVTAYPKERSMGSVPHPESTTFLGDEGILQRDIREDISKFVNKLAMGDPRQAINENSATVITMAGENRGAAMHVGTESAQREGSVPIHRSYKLDQHDDMETSTDGEGSSRRRMENQKTGEDTTSAYINSNVQSINNSIVLNSSCSERNPGVHLNLSHKQKDPINTEEKSESIKASKSELNKTPAQKFTHEPTVRRRCLRGLFLEPSDTEQNNPEKPRRHGCQYSCEKKRDKDKH